MSLNNQAGLTDLVHMVVMVLCDLVCAMGESNIVKRRP